MKRLLRVGWIGSFLFSGLVYPTAWLLDRSATEAWAVDVHPPSMVAMNKDDWITDAPPKDSPGYAKAVMKIYGNPADESNRFLFVPRDRFIHPEEMPSLTLLTIDRHKSQDPLQVITVYFFAKWAFGCSAGVGLLMLGGWRLARKPAVVAPASAAPVEPDSRG